MCVKTTLINLIEYKLPILPTDSRPAYHVYTNYSPIVEEHGQVCSLVPYYTPEHRRPRWCTVATS